MPRSAIAQFALALAAGCALGLVLSTAVNAQANEQVRVTCQDPILGYGSFDMPRADVIETPCGWTLHFPRRPEGKRTEVWFACQVHP